MDMHYRKSVLSSACPQNWLGLIGAEFIRIMEPMNEKLISHYLSGDKGFTLTPAKRDVPHYLVKKL